MPLYPETSARNLESLLAQPDLSPIHKELLTRINAFFSRKELQIGIGKTSPGFNQLLMDEVRRYTPGKDIASYSENTIRLLEQLNDQESKLQRQTHASRGRFTSHRLHQRDSMFHDQLTEEDLHLLMPKATSDIEILVPTDKHPKMIEITTEQLQSSLANGNINHIVMTIGPGHWNAIFLTKLPKESESTRYEIEFFDSYNYFGFPSYAAQTERIIIQDMLPKCGINKEQLIIKRTHPNKPQRDAHSCGDYVCAKSHHMMKLWGAPPEAYKQALIDTLEQGDRGNALRLASIIETQKIEGTPTLIVLDPTENAVFQRTCLTPERLPFKALTEVLISKTTRYSIFQVAKAAEVKREAGLELDDEELASILQSEEFLSVNLK